MTEPVSQPRLGAFLASQHAAPRLPTPNARLIMLLISLIGPEDSAAAISDGVLLHRQKRL